ncbi:hypothetical protein DYB32_009437, partial [Aphanomyces invadans]
AMAGILARVVCHPLDVAKANLQVAGQVAYRNSYHVLQSTFQYPSMTSVVLVLMSIFCCRKEGVRGLYRGFGVILLGSAPATCLYLTSYDRWLESYPAFQSNVFVTSFSAGVMAEALSCVFWVPIDVIKERMQVQRKTGGGVFYKNAVDAWRTIARTEGVRGLKEGFVGLWKGVGARVAFQAPLTGLTLALFEKCKHVCAFAV